MNVVAQSANNMAMPLGTNGNGMFGSGNQGIQLVDRVGTFLWAIAVNNNNFDTFYSSEGNNASALSNVANSSLNELEDFDFLRPPSIDLVSYLKRLVKYQDKWSQHNSAHHNLGRNESTANVGSDQETQQEINNLELTFNQSCSLGTQSLMIALIYLHRISREQTCFKITTKNIHRLCMIAMLLAAKFLEDIPFSQKFWSQVAGISLHEVNKLELSFCKLIKFKLFVSAKDYASTANFLASNSTQETDSIVPVKQKVQPSREKADSIISVEMMKKLKRDFVRRVSLSSSMPQYFVS